MARSLNEFRQHFASILEGLEHPPLGMAAALAEECGEVSKVLLDHHAYGGALDQTDLGGELIDVFICLCEIATAHGIDLDSAAEAKALDIAARAPKWRVELAEALKRSRGESPR